MNENKINMKIIETKICNSHRLPFLFKLLSTFDNIFRTTSYFLIVSFSFLSTIRLDTICLLCKVYEIFSLDVDSSKCHAWTQLQVANFQQNYDMSLKFIALVDLITSNLSISQIKFFVHQLLLGFRVSFYMDFQHFLSPI